MRALLSIDRYALQHVIRVSAMSVLAFLVAEWRAIRDVLHLECVDYSAKKETGCVEQVM